MQAVGSHADRRGDDGPYSIGVAHGQLHGNSCAHAVPQDVSAVDPELVEESDDVAGQRLRCDHPFDVGSTAVTLQLNADDLVLLGQRRDQLSEAEVDGQHATVQQYQRRAGTVDLVVHVQPADVGVPALPGARGVRRARRGHRVRLLWG